MQRREVLLAFSVALVSLNVAAKWFPHLRLIVWAFGWGSLLSLLGFLALALFTVRRLDAADEDSGALRNIKPLAFTSPAAWSRGVAAMRLEETIHRSPLYPPSFVISDSLDVLLDRILRDFVTAWYSNISQDPSFSAQVEKTIRHALEQLRDRLQNIDLVEVLVGRLAPLLTSHLNDFSAAERAVRGKHLNKNLTESEELDLAIAAKYRDGKLHPAASLKFSDTKLAQQEHLRGIAEKVLPVLLPESERKSRVLGTIVREIVACAVLFPIMGILSDPDTWNQFVEAIGRSTLQDRKTVRKLRAALDQHATPYSPHAHGTSKHHPKRDGPHRPFARLGAGDDERTFERFIRSIRLCNNLPDARRLRSEINAQLKRDARIDGKEGWAVYIKRLETGKRAADQRVAYLSNGMGGGKCHPVSRIGYSGGRVISNRIESATLDEILRDSSGLSYFMEHMDRQKRLALVQFWLVVDGLRNPLEDDITSSDDEEGTSSLNSFPAWTQSDRNDLAQIHDAYLSMRELQISDKSKRAVKEFLKAGDNATQVQYAKARSAVLRAQTTVFREMQKRDFKEFKASDLFYKYLASDETAAAHGAVEEISFGRSSEQMQRSASWEDASRTTEPPDLMSSSRHSFDTSERNLEDWDFDPLSASRQSIEDEAFSPRYRNIPGPEDDIVEAMEAALNDIIEQRPTSLAESRNSGFQNSPEVGLMSPASQRSSIDAGRETIDGNGSTGGVSGILKNEKPKSLKPPSISSLGLVNAYTRNTVFSEDELFPDEDATADYNSGEDEHGGRKEGSPDDGASDDEIHQAAPGDLGLAEAISALTYDIEKLSTQEAVIDSLYRKAELTNNTVELRILRKSKASLQREVRRKELQRQQYIVQESDNSLFGRSTIRIKSTMVGSENGQEYALYIIEVQRKGGEQMPAAQWAVARRYSEFFQLHQQLRSNFASVRQLEFPRRRVVMKLQKDFLEKRRIALEKYLKSLLLIPDVCRSRDLRAFLSQQSIAPQSSPSPTDDRKDIMSRLYNSITDGMEDVLGNLPMLDQLSLAGANMITAATSQTTSSGTQHITDVAEAEAELCAFEDKEAEPFVKPICDLFLEIFELNRGSSWLRGRAVVVVLHQLLGGTIERKIREQTKMLVDEESLLKYIQIVQSSVSPPTPDDNDSGGRLRPGVSVEPPPLQKIRSVKEKSRTKTEAGVILATLIPDVAASVVGRANAQAASRRLFAAFNNHRLNTSILFAVLDEIIAIAFGDVLTN